MSKKSKHIDPENPPLGREYFVKATRGLPPGLGEAMKRARGKQKAPTKELISLRVDRETLNAYRRTGNGWQSRINATLDRAAKRLPQQKG